MSNFITTTLISAALESLIENAKKEIFLISPYLKIHRRLETLLKEKVEMGVSVYLVFGKDKDQSYIKNSPLNKSAALFYCERLHAKCYLSESKSIVTSMNLYDYSQVNNIEFGITTDLKEENFNSIRNEVIRIIKEAQPFNKAAIEVHSKISTIENPILMRQLHRDIVDERRIKHNGNIFYTEVCSYLMSIHEFKNNELYMDGSAILRSTVITKEQYLNALNKFRN